MDNRKEAEGSGITAPVTAGERISGIKEILGQAGVLLRRHRTLIIRTVLPAVYCLIFGGASAPMGISPFGISAVCAAPAGSSSLIAAAAATVSSLFVKGGFYITAACLAAAASLAVIRRFRGDVSDGASLRAALSMAMGAAQTAVRSLSGGITFYELCGVLLSAAICPVLTVALRGLFFSDKADPSAEGGIYAVLYTFTYCLRSLSLTGASAATAISMLGTLYASYAFGMSRGIITGVAFGLAADPAHSLIYAAAAAGSGILMSISPISAVMAGVLLALSLGIRGGGAASFSELFPEFVFSAAVAGPLFHYRLIPLPRGREGSFAREISEAEGQRLRRTKERLSSLAESLTSVSSVMERMSKALCRPPLREIRQMCDEAFDESCHACVSRDLCWDREYRATSAAVSGIASSLRAGKAADAGALTDGMRSRCAHADSILWRINMGVAMAEQTLAASDSTAVTAENYASMSRLIGEISEEADREDGYDSAASRALAVRLGGIGLRASETAVYGRRHRRVFVCGLELGCSAGGEEIRAAAESVLECAMTLPEYRIDGRQVTMELHTAERFAVEFGRCSAPKKGECSGDSVTSFRGDGGYFYTLISDGMGSGGDAALTSGISTLFLERMLSSGCTLASAMDMLNSFLARRRIECFTTVDLMEADLITGELSFVKSGAAPSFVLRDGRLFRLASKTVPVGIVTPLDAEELRFTAKAGDLVVMLSDGAVPDSEEPAWLYELLCGDGSTPLLTPDCDPGKAAERIAAGAAREYGSSDDVTVAVIRIKDAAQRR